MPYSLTVDGYTFANPPEEYRKSARLANSPQTAFNKRSTNFYQSDSQELQYRADGTLALDPALGGTDDLAELEKLQEIAIQGGEVEVAFDPFFSGKCVIEDDPFRQSGGESTYQFTFTVNTDSTDDSTYPSHSSPETGNTFEFGHLDLGYDPREVQQNYERQTETVQRLQGIARSVDIEGLIPTVTVSGMIDGGGQAELWEIARKNRLGYLSAEFQNGWALVDSVSIRNSPAAPDYLTGLFQYDLDLLVVMDPGSGIGEASKYVDRGVQDSNTYVSNCDDDGVYERLGTDSDDYPFALDYRVSGGTGKLTGTYIEWAESFGTLDQNATNYLYAEDPDTDGYGQVNVGTSGFPADTVHLYEVDTGTSSVDAIRDQRSCLTGTRLSYDDLGDLNFIDTLSITDELSSERLSTFSDQVTISDPTLPWLGITAFTETLAVDDPVTLRGISSFADTAAVLDGGSASATSTSQRTLTWDTASDWNAASDESGTVHDSFGALPGGDVIQLGYPNRDIGDSSLEAYWPLDDSAGPITDVTGNGHDLTRDGGTLQKTGVLNTDSIGFSSDVLDGGDDPDLEGTPFTMVAWCKPDASMQSNQGGWGKWNRAVSGNEGQYLVRSEDANGQWHADFHDGSTIHSIEGGSVDAAVWQMITLTWDGSTVRLYKNDTETDSASTGSSMNNESSAFRLGEYDSGGYYEGDLGPVQFYTRALDASEITTLYQDPQNGSLTTATKSYSDPTQPDLENLAYDLQGESIEVDVVGSPGTVSEETHTVTLDGATAYAVSWTDSHTDFRIEVQPSTSTITVSPTFTAAALVGSVAVGDPDQNPNTTWTINGATYDTQGHEYEGGGVISTYGA